MHQVLFGSALLISFLGGAVALLAPCCVSVMLPAFFATGFGRRSGIAAATEVFARRAADTDTGPGDSGQGGPPSPDAVDLAITDITAASVPAGRPREGSEL
jgi:hypothetical protein